MKKLALISTRKPLIGTHWLGLPLNLSLASVLSDACSTIARPARNSSVPSTDDRNGARSLPANFRPGDHRRLRPDRGYWHVLAGAA
jgi:hypothetical protein